MSLLFPENPILYSFPSASRGRSNPRHGCPLSPIEGRDHAKRQTAAVIIPFILLKQDRETVKETRHKKCVVERDRSCTTSSGYRSLIYYESYLYRLDFDLYVSKRRSSYSRGVRKKGGVTYAVGGYSIFFGGNSSLSNPSDKCRLVLAR
jgi:hypothetical protein